MTDLEDRLRRYAASVARDQRPIRVSEVTGRRARPRRARVIATVAAVTCAAVATAGFVIARHGPHHDALVEVSPTTTRPPRATQPARVAACPAAGLHVTSTAGEYVLPEWLPAGFMLTQGSQTDLGERGELTYAIPGNASGAAADPSRVELLRYHTSQSLSALTIGAHHPITVNGRPAVYTDGEQVAAYSAVGWEVAPGTALVATGYELSKADLLRFADHVEYHTGTGFTYPTHPRIGITRAAALAVLHERATETASATLSSFGEVDAVTKGLATHDASITPAVPVTQSVWVVWAFPQRVPDGTALKVDAPVINADSGARITTLIGVTVRTLDALTDRSESSCEPPFGVLTRSELLWIQAGGPGVTETATLTTLGRFIATSTGNGFANCVLDNCDPTIPVWVVTSVAHDQRFSAGEDQLVPGRRTPDDLVTPGHPGSASTTLPGSFQVIPYDARTGPQDTALNGSILGSGPPPADLATIRDLTKP